MPHLLPQRGHGVVTRMADDPDDRTLRLWMQDMAALQRGYNKRVHPEWENQGYGYLRAVWVECGEALDHYGWKWWMHQERDLDQVRLELVDIWHFGLSELLRLNRSLDQLARELLDATREPVGRSFDEVLERLASEALLGAFRVRTFGEAVTALPMSLRELYATYVGKNVLNSFRRSRGYAEGTYVKIWGDREDNIHLAEMARALDPAEDDFRGRLHEALEQRYRRYAQASPGDVAQRTVVRA